MRIFRGKQKYFEKGFRESSTNPGLRVEKPPTKHLSHGKAHCFGIRLEDNEHVRTRENIAETSVGRKSAVQSLNCLRRVFSASH
jgi:hypothetical protein